MKNRSGFYFIVIAFIQIFTVLLGSFAFNRKLNAMEIDSEESGTVKSVVYRGILVNTLSILPYIGYLFYMIYSGGDQIVNRDQDDLAREYLINGIMEVISIVLIPLGIAAQVETHRMYDELKQKTGEDETMDEMPEAVKPEYMPDATKTNYIRSFAFARSILRNKMN